MAFTIGNAMLYKLYFVLNENIIYIILSKKEILIMNLQKVVTFPNFILRSFLRFLTFNLLHKLLVPSIKRYSSHKSMFWWCWSLARLSVMSASDFWFFSERESPDTKPLSGLESVWFWLVHWSWWNHLATLAVDESCNDK